MNVHTFTIYQVIETGSIRRLPIHIDRMRRYHKQLQHESKASQPLQYSTAPRALPTASSTPLIVAAMPPPLRSAAPKYSSPEDPICDLVHEQTSQREIDGDRLHGTLADVTRDQYTYDEQIKEDTWSTARSVFGVFKCYNCIDRYYQPRTWSSSGICAEIWMSSDGHRYRTSLHFQQCSRCNTFVEPDVDIDDYVTKVVRILDRWTGQHWNSWVKPVQHRPLTGPHKTDKCHGCIKGVCPQRHNEWL